MIPGYADQLPLVPPLLAQHLLLSVTALAAGAAVGVPLGVLLRSPLVGSPTATQIQKVPTDRWSIQITPALVILALMVAIVGSFGFWPAWLALSLYALVGVATSTWSALATLTPAQEMSARAAGLSEWQTLRILRWPLGLPAVIAGLRQTALWTLGAAALASLVRQPTLGSLIIDGLSSNNVGAILVGSASIAALLVATWIAFHAIDHAIVHGRRPLLAISLLATAALLAVGMLPLRTVEPAANSLAFRIGTDRITEQHILGELLSSKVRDAQLATQVIAGKPLPELFDNLSLGEIDCYVDYSGRIWREVMGRTDTPPRRQMMVEIRRYLAGEPNIVMLGRLGFERAPAMVMDRGRAAQLGVRTISDLKSHDRLLRLGGGSQFLISPQWAKIRTYYDLSFGTQTPIDDSSAVRAVRDGVVDIAIISSTDGRIADANLLVLQDDRVVFPVDDAILLLSAKAFASPEFVRQAMMVLNTIDDNAIRQATQMVDIQGQSPAMAALKLNEQVSAVDIVNPQPAERHPRSPDASPETTEPGAELISPDFPKT